jgi:2-haloacid dehalogenase
MEDFLIRICNDEWNREQDKGRLFSEGIKLLTDLYPEKSELIHIYFNRWPEQLGGPIVETVELLKKLAENNINLYSITNWSHETFPHALHRYDFLKLFSDIVVSGKEKILKPDPKIYRMLLERNSLQANESVFVDDKLENVQGAKAIGMKGILFTTPAELKQKLEALLHQKI